jgi:CubicO group peptidase (beta-lactamase class C family)
MTTSLGPLAAPLQPFVDRSELAGAVLLAADAGGVLACECLGYADIAAGVPMAPDSVFWIASQSKPITGTALMLLIEEGRVGLDDPVERYLPEFTGQWLIAEEDDTHRLLRKPDHPIMVREILCHTSGLPFASALETPTLDGLPLAVAVRSHAMTPLTFAPGTQYAYSNAGINTAGRIIEVVTGQAFEDFVDERLLYPLGMSDTTFWPSPAQQARLAKSYRPNTEQYVLEEVDIAQLACHPLHDRRRCPVPAGGYFSTAADVATFCRMILNGGVLNGRRYLTDASVREMTRKHTGDLPESYGLGWDVGDGYCGHGGAHATGMTIDWARGLVTVFLVQHAGGFLGDAGNSHGLFKAAAEAAFGTRG